MTRRPALEGNDRLSPDFIDFIVCINARRVDVVLIGGYALGVHGVIRATGDIDFLYRPSKANVRALCRAMEDFGAPLSVIDEQALMTPDTITQFGQPPYRIDLLNRIDGVSFDAVWDGATSTRLDEQPIRVIGLAELRANKAATGRTKDAEDLRKLSARRRRKSR